MIVVMTVLYTYQNIFAQLFSYSAHLAEGIALLISDL